MDENNFFFNLFEEYNLVGLNEVASELEKLHSK